VEIARRNSALDSINVHSAAEPLDFDRGFFDLITAFDVVEHLATPADFLREVARTLRPGGVFLLSTPNPASIGALLKHDSSHVYTDRTHVSIKPPSEWRAAVIDAGFGVVRDGTDGLWDWPYLPVVPKLLQRALFAGTSQVLGAVDIMYPWSRGENYLCLARRK